LIDFKLAIRCYVAAAVPPAAMPDSFPPRARAWNEIGEMDIALTIRESCGSSLYSDFLLDVRALRGNR